MTALAFWLAIAPLFWLATRLGRRLGLVPIVSQLLAACLLIPALLLADAPGLSAELLAPDWLGVLYPLAFGLLLVHILSDIAELEVSTQSLKIAVPSFAVPFACGLACAAWLLPWLSWASAIGIGLLFSITAIPVLFLYLSHIGYDAQATRRLLHAAVLVDLACWGIFGLVQGSAAPLTLLGPLAGAALPWLLHRLGVRQPLAYSLPFVVLLPLLQLAGCNALVFGIGYLLNLAWHRQPLRLPGTPERWQQLLGLFAVPLILTVGVLKVRLDQSWAAEALLPLLALLVLPIASKLAGNWLGLRWADPTALPGQRWRESVLLNIRGLTEIVFLNLLLEHQLLAPSAYLSLLLMSLFSTLLPMLIGIRPTQGTIATRSPHGAA